MKTTLLIAALATGGVLVAADASAQGREMPTFQELDLDNNGTVTLEELAAQRITRFNNADTDGDGALSSEEMTAQANADAADRVARIVERMLTRLDANEDGLIQLDEMPEANESRLERMLDRADADEDGSLSQEEFDAAQDRLADRMQDRGGKGRGDGHGHGGKGHGGGDRGNRG